MASGERGFKGILLSSIFGKCKIPFQCSPQPVIFQTDGNTYYIEIIDGYGKFADIDEYNDNKNGSSRRNQHKPSHQMIDNNTDTDSNAEKYSYNSTTSDIDDQNTIKTTNSSNTSSSDNTSQNFDQVIHAETHSIKGTDDENLLFIISLIVEHFKVVCMALYDSPVTKIELSFGIKTNKIHLIDGNVTTTPNTYTSFLFKSIPNGEETFIDYFVSSVLYDPKHDQIETETINDDSASSFSINSTKSTTFENSTKTTKTTNQPTCYSNFPDCLQGRYKVPLLYVMFYFAKQYFPEVDAAKLYTLLKIRLFKTKSDKEVHVCVRCVHVYTDEKRDHQIDKQDKDYFYFKNIPSYEDEHLFINKPKELDVKVTKRRIRLHAKKAPISIRRMMEGKPSHDMNEVENMKRTRNNDEWNNFYDNLTKKKSKSKSKSTTCSFPFNKSSQISFKKFKEAKKNIEIPHFSPKKSSSLKLAPNVYSNHHLLRNSWNTENIVKRFQSKSYSIDDPQYIEPRNCHILENMNY